MLNSNTWNHLTVYKQMSSNISYRNKFIYQLFAYNLYICVCVCVYVYYLISRRWNDAVYLSQYLQKGEHSY